MGPIIKRTDRGWVEDLISGRKSARGEAKVRSGKGGLEQQLIVGETLRVGHAPGTEAEPEIRRRKNFNKRKQENAAVRTPTGPVS